MSTRLPLVYHEDYSPPFPAGHRFPMEKFRLLHEHLSASGILGADNWQRPELCPDEVLALAHAPAYIRVFQAGELAPPLQRQLGLPWSEALVRRTIRAAAPCSPWSWRCAMAWPVTSPGVPIMRTTTIQPASASSTTWRSWRCRCWKAGAPGGY